MRALITRPQPDADAFAAQCAAAGVDAVIAPLMAVRLRRAEIDLARVGALAFTSANGVRAFAAGCADRLRPVFAVGEASAQAARDAGFRNVNIAGGDVDSLAALIAEHRKRLEGEVLHAAGSRQAGDLAAALLGNAVPARRIILYDIDEARTLPLAARRALERYPPLGWVALFSPQSAALFVRLARESGLEDRLGATKAACLSAAVAEAARGLPWRAIEVAAARRSGEMVALMAARA